mmetsp:Transcript_3245/g.9230  ORF Transcript_3245/g.9230 Transcript_3245/m.9230 type:complete len:211 (-) Transcript_3245:1925-2557(-)
MAFILHCPPQSCHHITHAANLGDRRHLHADVHNLKWAECTRGTCDWDVVVKPFVVVKEPALHVARVAEDHVNEASILRHLELLLRLDDSAGRRNHSDWHPALVVLPAVPRATSPDLRSPIQDRILLVVENLHLVACFREERVGVHDLTLSVPPHAGCLCLLLHLANRKALTPLLSLSQLSCPFFSHLFKKLSCQGLDVLCSADSRVEVSS